MRQSSSGGMITGVLFLFKRARREFKSNFGGVLAVAEGGSPFIMIVTNADLSQMRVFCWQRFTKI